MWSWSPVPPSCWSSLGDRSGRPGHRPSARSHRPSARVRRRRARRSVWWGGRWRASRPALDRSSSVETEATGVGDRCEQVVRDLPQVGHDVEVSLVDELLQVDRVGADLDRVAIGAGEDRRQLASACLAADRQDLFGGETGKDLISALWGFGRGDDVDRLGSIGGDRAATGVDGYELPVDDVPEVGLLPQVLADQRRFVGCWGADQQLVGLERRAQRRCIRVAGECRWPVR